MMMTSSLLSRISFSRIMSSRVRPASTVTTRLPMAFSARTMGRRGATPTPPPAQSTVCSKRSILVARPKGPTTSRMLSPDSRAQSFCVLTPTACTTSVMVPRSVLASAMVRGIRSPFSSRRRITKFPARRERAINGAETTNLKTFSENCSLPRILYIFFFNGKVET